MENMTKERLKVDERGSLFSRAKEWFNGALRERSEDGLALFYDLTLFAVGFLFSRCHLLFGARPLALALVAVLPVGVWSALFGVAIGSLTMGADGIIFAASATVTVFLRAALAFGDGEGRGSVFRESLLVRMSLAIIGGFLVAIYEILISSLTEASLLFGLSMIILPPILTFVFSGAFSAGIGADELIFSSDNILALAGKEEKEKYNLIFFRLSGLMLLFFVGLSLGGVDIFGISLSYVFASLITLLVAKRFGALHGLATGFVSALGISGTLSVSFALAGLCAGIMFGFGTGYALIAGGAALCAWSSYAGGLSGFLSTMPEYVIASSLAIPILKSVGKSTPITQSTADPATTSEDMVGTMALAYQNKYSGCVDSLECALSGMSAVMRDFEQSTDALLSPDDYREIVTRVAERFCLGCGEESLCTRESIRPAIKNADIISKKLAAGQKISDTDINTDTEFCQISGEIAEAINAEVAKREAQGFYHQSCNSADEYELICRLLNSARLTDDAERTVDDSLTATLTEILERHGFTGGTIRAFGERRRHFLVAGEDSDGSKITSPDLRRDIEAALGIRLGPAEFFRREKMVLMECEVRPKLSVQIATAARAGDENEVSGDTISSLESSDDRFFALISDGMGSGEVAKKTSEFVSRFLSAALVAGASKEILLHILNHAIRARREECSATVDLFELDLLSGEATILKSGAAPSYVKRGSSIFRIRSQTAPIGLLSSIDSEKIKVEVRPGDYVVMLSDGIADSMEDAPWLLLMLGESAPENLTEYADKILSEAQKNAKTGDDMSVIVMKIDEA